MTCKQKTHTMKNNKQKYLFGCYSIMLTFTIIQNMKKLIPHNDNIKKTLDNGKVTSIH